MKLKTQENIRKLELLALLSSAMVVSGQNIKILSELYDFIEKNNININDIDMFCKAIYSFDVFTSFKTQKATIEYKELKSLYEKVITNSVELISEFDLKNPISVFALYIYMYRSGYLSYNKNFKYSLDMKDFSCINGLDVIRGKCVCRSVAGMLNDIYREMDMKSHCMLVKTNGDIIRELDHISELVVEKTDDSRKFVKLVNALTKYIPTANHMIIAVSSNDNSYILDPMNDGVMYNGGKNNLILSNNSEYSMKNFPTLTYIYYLLGMYKGDLGIYKTCKSVDKEEYRKLYLEALKICKDNIDMLEKFYEANKDIYSEIYYKSEEQSGLIKRVLPIIPSKKK